MSRSLRAVLFRWAVALLAALGSAGCRSMRAGASAPAEPAETIQVSYAVGAILKVNAAHGYVVLRCASLPFEGEEATVYRADQIVARLRFNGPMRYPFAVADVVDGAPETGDVVRVTRMKTVESTDGGVP